MSRDAITADNSITSPLLRLPRELRDLIYTYLFFDPPNWIRLDVVSVEDAPSFEDACTKSESPAHQASGFLFSCKQIYNEAFLTYFPPEHRIYYMYNISAGSRRIASMSEDMRASLEDVRLCMKGGDYESCTLAKANRLALYKLNKFSEDIVVGPHLGRLMRKMKLLETGLKQRGIILEKGVLKWSTPPKCDRVWGNVNR